MNISYLSTTFHPWTMSKFFGHALVCPSQVRTGSSKKRRDREEGISELAFTSQAHPCKGRSAKYPLPELHGVGDPPLGQANSILGRGHHTSQTQKEVNCQGFPPTVNSWKVVSQLHPNPLVFWLHVDHILDAGSGWNISRL